MQAPFALPGLRKATPDGGLKEFVMFLNDPFWSFKNNIFYRGYSNNGDRVIKKEHYKPRFYVTSNTETGYKSLDGYNVGPIEFNSMYEAGQWYRDNFHIIMWMLSKTTTTCYHIIIQDP